MKRVLLLLCFLSIQTFAEEKEPLDVETLAFGREEVYPTLSYEKIIIYSLPRTGSSLVYNLFRYLFEKEEYLSLPHQPFSRQKKVMKTHDQKNVHSLKSKKTLCVVTTRDPIQSALSLYRVQKNKIQKISDWCQSQMKKQKKFQRKLKKLEKRGYHFFFISYDEIEQGIPYLLDKIEDQFHITISHADREKLIHGYSRENVAIQTQSLENFQSSFHLYERCLLIMTRSIELERVYSDSSWKAPKK